MRDPRDDSALVFAELAAQLETGEGDPEAFFAAHREIERELRELYRGWREADGLLRELAGSSSVVHAALATLEEDASEERCRAALARLQGGREFRQRYELGAELGRGGMGVVRRARDRLLGRELALKVVRERAGGSRERARLLRRFLAEAELTGRLQHPAIVAVHDLGLDDEGRVYFTMPLVEGRTLARVLALAREGAEGWTRARVLQVLLRVADAVAFAHAKGVLHRDLKPANVLVGAYGEVYVLDWGLARAVGEPGERVRGGGDGPDEPEWAPAMTLAGEVLGTPGYMAPEQALGGAVDARADVHALGAILYESLAGRRPYASEGDEPSSEEVLARMRAGPPEDVAVLAPAAPRELAAIARKAMARAPEARYPGAGAFAGDLRAYLEGRVVGAHERGPLAELRKWIRRNRALALASVLALVALGAGTVFRARALRDSREAAWQALRVERSELASELRNARRPEYAVETAVAFPAPGEPPRVVRASELPAVARDYEGYVGVLARHDARDVASLARFLDDAPPQERLALLDEVYWLELRLAALARVEERADVAGIRAQLAAVEDLVARFETRTWRRTLRRAWQLRIAGDPTELDSLAQEVVAGAAAEELEWLSVLLSSLGDDERLRPVLVRLLELDPSSFWGHFRLATLSPGQERLLHAYAATALNPDSMQAWYNRGWNHQNISGAPFGDLDEARRCYERANALEPGRWEPAINLSSLVSVEEGITLMERTIAVQPAAVLYERLADLLRTAHDCVRCVEVAREGVARFPDAPKVWAMLGECHAWLQQWDEAREALERAVALAPEQPIVHEHLGLAYANLERFEEAVPHLVRSVELGNGNARGHLQALRDAIATRPDLATLAAEVDERLRE